MDLQVFGKMAELLNDICSYIICNLFNHQEYLINPYYKIIFFYLKRLLWKNIYIYLELPQLICVLYAMREISDIFMVYLSLQHSLTFSFYPHSALPWVSAFGCCICLLHSFKRSTCLLIKLG